MLTETGGRIAEFVNPKYADAEKVASPVRTPKCGCGAVPGRVLAAV